MDVIGPTAKMAMAKALDRFETYFDGAAFNIVGSKAVFNEEMRQWNVNLVAMLRE